jgi:hypothetical protein
MDTSDTRVSNLLFLLTAAPLGLGCIITSDDGDTDAATSTPATTNATTTGETDDPPAETTVVPGDTTETPGTTSEELTSSTTETPADTTAGEDTTTGSVEVPEACVTYGDQYLACIMDEELTAAAIGYCAESLTMYEAYGPDCLAAAIDVYACLSALPCEEFADPKVANMACMKQNTALEMACFKE